MRLQRPSLLDLVIAAGVLALGLAELAAGQLDGPTPVAAVAVVCYPVALLLRCTSLWAAFLLAFSTIPVSYRLGLSQEDFLSSIVACLLLVFHTGYRLPTREAALAFVFAYVTVVASGEVTWGSLGWLLMIIGGAWGAGRALRNRHMLIEDLRATTAELEASRDELARRAVAEERLRIAQDIHDVVSHSVTVMLVQAGVAERKARRDPDAAAEAARSVQASGREAMDELRQLLGVLRPGAEDVRGGDTAPQPGLDQLPALVAHFREAGLEVEYDAGPVAGAVPAGVAMTAYRVAQEALTNVLRHSLARRATLRVRGEGGRFCVEVDDPGPARPSPGGGHGLVGMRERVQACGGSLRAGPAAADGADGFAVAASLPLEADR